VIVYENLPLHKILTLKIFGFNIYDRVTAFQERNLQYFQRPWSPWTLAYRQHSVNVGIFFIGKSYAISTSSYLHSTI
jgi:hypothetical protein